MGTRRLPSQVIADDSSRSWRFEINRNPRLVMTNGGAVAAHSDLAAVRPTTGDSAYVGLYTGGETGTTRDYAWILYTDGNLYLQTASFVNAIIVDPNGKASINGCIILTGAATWDPGNITAGNNATTTLTVTGASTSNSIVHAGIPNGFIQDGLSLQAYVSAANTVTLRLYNFSGAGIDPPNNVYRVAVFQF